MIAAIYARKSTEQNGVADDAKSVTRQIERSREFAARHGWTVADAQIFVHKHVTPGAPDPLGWKTQIGEWAAFLATYERRVKLLPRHVQDGRPEWFDLSPAIGAAAGNVFVNASASVTMRLGYNLPLQFINSIKALSRFSPGRSRRTTSHSALAAASTCPRRNSTIPRSFRARSCEDSSS